MNRREIIFAVTAALMARGRPLDAVRICAILRNARGITLTGEGLDEILEAAQEEGFDWFSGYRGCRWFLRPGAWEMASAAVADARRRASESRLGCLYCPGMVHDRTFCASCGLPWSKCVHCGGPLETGPVCDLCGNRVSPPDGAMFSGVGQTGFLEYFSKTGGHLMVYVPSGSFTMGAPESDLQALPHERPAHRVFVHGFLMGIHLVTFDEYDRYCSFTGARKPDSQGFGRRGNPVFDVSWKEASSYASWAGTRLPTEAEWEKAARGLLAFRYPWGDEPPEQSRSNYSGSMERPSPPGIFPAGASPWGCLDMAGNLWEWCRDWYSPSYYKTVSVRGRALDPFGPTDGTHRVTRGGSWNSHPSVLRCSARDFLEPGARNCFVGFRIAMEAAGVKR